MKHLFIAGLILQLLAQISFSIPTEIINLLEPIDFIHWAILLGMLFIIPYGLQFSFGLFRKLGGSMTFLGACAMIGMSAIDMVLWMYRHDREARNDIVTKLIEEPSIWPVFFTVGPAFFFIGLTLQACAYLKVQTWSVVTVICGAILTRVGGLFFAEYRLVYLTGFLLFVAGLIRITVVQHSNSNTN